MQLPDSPTRMAGQNVPALPLALAASGMMPGLPLGARASAEKQLRQLDPALADSLLNMLQPPGSDPRDYRVEPGLWRSQILPMGVSIDQAIRDGVW